MKPMAPAAPHHDVLRQHHSGRRLGDHDHRSERDRAGLRRRRPAWRRRAEPERTGAPPSETTVAAGVPRRLQPAEGGAAVARHPARGDRCPQDRGLQRPPHGAISRSAHAARAAERRACASRTSGAQPLLVFSDGDRSMALVVDEIVDIVEERLDIEVGSDVRAFSARRSSRAKRPRSSMSAISCRWPTRTGSAARQARQRARARRAAGRRLAVLPQHADAGAPGRGLRGHVAPRAHGGACACVETARVRCRGDGHRDAGHGRRCAVAEAVRADPRTADMPMIALSSVDRAEIDRTRPPRRLPRLRRQVRSPGPDRGDQGADR